MDEHAWLTLVVGESFDVVFSVDGLLLLLLMIALAIFLGIKLAFGSFGWRRFDIDEADFGLGSQRIRLRPNDTDREIAYKVWVELSTRKIGLPIELTDDVIVEIYNSWYNFFSVTRELIKSVPISKVRRKDTQQIIDLSIEVLNSGIRPHLTKWQAKFRRWYENALDDAANRASTPQAIQRKFPDYASLSEDLMRVNQQLMRYRDKMYELVSSP